MKKGIQVAIVAAASILLAVTLVVVGITYQTQPRQTRTSEVYNNSYTAYVDRVLAGNRMFVDVNIGFGINLDNLPVQLNGIRTEPIRTDKGDRARRFSQSQIEGQNVVISVYEQNETGRYLVDIKYDGKDLGEELLKTGHGEKS